MTLDLIFRILHDNPKALISPLHCFTPYPGCTMFNLAIQEGFNPPKSLEEWINYSTTSMNALRTDKEKKFYEMMVFLSLFIDDKCKEVVESKLIQYVSKCYQPIARYRMKHQFLTGILSKKAKDIFYPDY